MTICKCRWNLHPLYCSCAHRPEIDLMRSIDQTILDCRKFEQETEEAIFLDDLEDDEENWDEEEYDEEYDYEEDEDDL